MQNPGLSPEIQEAINRRSQGASSPQLQQQSPGAAGQPQMPQPTPQSQLPTVQQPQQKFVPQDRKDLIVQALIQQLKIENDAEKQAQQFQQPAPQGGAVSDKISLLRHEGKPQDQAVAIALSMKRRGEIGGGVEMGNRVNNFSSSPMNQQSGYPFGNFNYGGGYKNDY